jgi:hypothetical protein
MAESDDKEHLLQRYGILPEFEIISVTSLEDFMSTYNKVANTPDDIGKMIEVSDLLSKNTTDIPGFVIKGERMNRPSNPELDKVSYALIEFIMKKTTDPQDWAYVLTNVINKMGLEFDDDEENLGEME